MFTTAPDTLPEDVSAPFALTLFGPMLARVEGRPLPHSRTYKALWLLALLTLRPDRPVERAWLAGALWPEADLPGALNNLRPALSELRRILGVQGWRLQSPSRQTLCLVLADAEVDVLAFDAAIADGTHAGLERAVALYRGPLLEGITAEWAGQERTAREQECLWALQTLAAAALAAGDNAGGVSYHRRAVTLAPWQESARRGLMEALARTGDRNGAMQVYREFLALLRGVPKAVPEKETSALYVRLRAEGQHPLKKMADNETQAETAPKVSGYLPHPLTFLIGREDERSEVIMRLRKSRMVTLTGPGGIGKTRLALAVAAESVPEYADGVWFAALDALADGKLVAGQITGLLGVKEEAGRTLLESLTHYLKSRRLLLVLDNCEQVLDESAKVADHLLRICGGVHILATSREALRITGEMVWAVPALSVPELAHLPKGQATLLRMVMGYEGVHLFVERAQAVQKSFALTGDNALAVAQICARLEGIPLAIELAAARMKAMTAGDIAARLDDYLGLLTGRNRAVQSRQQTLRATLNWSYDLLSESERLLLARLSVFAGGWTLEAAEQVGSGASIESEQVLDLLTSLADKSLVVFEERESGGRYRLLDMVRQYAAERLENKTPLARASHLKWALALAEKAEPLLKGAEWETWMPCLDAERDNLRVGLEWCEAAGEKEDHLRLAGALWQFWNFRGDFSEARDALERALACAGEQGTVKTRAKALNAAAAAAYYQHDYDAAQSRSEAALRLCRDANDLFGIATSLNNLGNVALNRGDYDQARALYEESLSLRQMLDDRWGIAKTLSNLGNVARYSDSALARTLYEQSLSLQRELGDRTTLGRTMLNLAKLIYKDRDYPAAQTLAEESLALAREAENKSLSAEALHVLGNVYAVLKDYESAQSCYEECLRLAHVTNSRSMAASALMGLGYSALTKNDLISARTFYQQARHLFADLGERHNEAMTLNWLGKMAYELGETPSAQALYREGAAIFHTVRDVSGLEKSMRGLAAALLHEENEGKTGKTEQAVRLWGVAQALRECMGRPLLFEDEQEKYDRQRQQVRAALGEETFAALWEEGYILTWEQTISHVLAAQ